jgi:hypothetical protein
MMMQMYTNNSRPGEMVYASFCGGGSTSVMTARLNRIGFDVRPEPWRCQ